LRVTTSFYSSPNGKKTTTQSIQCQSFLELANSVYFTYELIVAANKEKDQPEGAIAVVENTARKNFKQLNEKLDAYFSEIFNTKSPDDVVLQLFLFLLGIDSDKVVDLQSGFKGSFFDSIYLPNQIAKILNKKTYQSKNFSYADRVWQIYNFYGGIQTYEPKNSGKPWEDFTPKIKKTFSSLDQSGQNSFSSKNEKIPKQKFNVVWRTPERTEGEVRMRMPLWQNESIWNILNQFSHRELNEMFTSLRINSENCICPNLTIREKPFSTGLYNYFTLGVINDEVTKSVKEVIENYNQEQKKSENLSSKLSLTGEDNSKFGLLKNNTSQNNYSLLQEKINLNKNNKVVKTYYGNLPRWIIDDSLISSINISYDEQDRINFVQIYPNASDAMGGTSTPEEILRYNSFLNSTVMDFKDIQRNGLRADIVQDSFFLVGANNVQSQQKDQTYISIWAKKRADWLFNGHLKLNASVSIQGIVEPICEGDNVEIKGILYHIESVEHSCGITINGLKSFRTVLRLSNGIVAKSVNSREGVPVYMSNLPSSTDFLGTQSSLIPSLSFDVAKKDNL
ncbi:hypothetical protein EBU95_04075, partial [bacterium]|nr:hypothetical protein [bacterium]